MDQALQFLAFESFQNLNEQQSFQARKVGCYNQEVQIQQKQWQQVQQKGYNLEVSPDLGNLNQVSQGMQRSGGVINNHSFQCYPSQFIENQNGGQNFFEQDQQNSIPQESKNEQNLLNQFMKNVPRQVYDQLRARGNLERSEHFWKHYERLKKNVTSYVNLDLFLFTGNIQEEIKYKFKKKSNQTRFNNLLTEYQYNYQELQFYTQTVRESLLDYLENQEEDYLNLMRSKQRKQSIDNNQIYQVLRLSIADFLKNEAALGRMVENKRIYNTKKIALKNNFQKLLRSDENSDLSKSGNNNNNNAIFSNHNGNSQISVHNQNQLNQNQILVQSAQNANLFNSPDQRFQSGGIVLECQVCRQKDLKISQKDLQIQHLQDQVRELREKLEHSSGISNKNLFLPNQNDYFATTAETNNLEDPFQDMKSQFLSENLFELTTAQYQNNNFNNLNNQNNLNNFNNLNNLSNQNHNQSLNNLNNSNGSFQFLGGGGGGKRNSSFNGSVYGIWDLEFENLKMSANSSISNNSSQRILELKQLRDQVVRSRKDISISQNWNSIVSQHYHDTFYERNSLLDEEKKKEKSQQIETHLQKQIQDFQQDLFNKLENHFSDDSKNESLGLRKKAYYLSKTNQLQEAFNIQIQVLDFYQKQFSCDPSNINLIQTVFELACYSVSEKSQLICENYLDLCLEPLQQKLEEDQFQLCAKNTFFQLKWLLLTRSYFLIENYEQALELAQQAFYSFLKFLPQKFQFFIFQILSECQAKNMLFYEAEYTLFQAKIFLESQVNEFKTSSLENLQIYYSFAQLLEKQNTYCYSSELSIFLHRSLLQIKDQVPVGVRSQYLFSQIALKLGSKQIALEFLEMTLQRSKITLIEKAIVLQETAQLLVTLYLENQTKNKEKLEKAVEMFKSCQVAWNSKLLEIAQIKEEKISEKMESKNLISNENFDFAKKFVSLKNAQINYLLTQPFILLEKTTETVECQIEASNTFIEEIGTFNAQIVENMNLIDLYVADKILVQSSFKDIGRNYIIAQPNNNQNDRSLSLLLLIYNRFYYDEISTINDSYNLKYVYSKFQ